MSIQSTSIHLGNDLPPARRRGTIAASVGFALGLVSALPAFAQDSGPLAEVVVTAQRREQNIMDVPLSVTSYSPEQLDQQGVRDISDLSRLTPSLRFGKTSGVSGNNGSNISIRGIASDVGSSTTAIYIDDTPIQIRSVGYFNGNTYPLVFDLERIEVLRGPQGTLFGAGAQGGAVRFLTPAPDFQKSSLSMRSELSSVENGGMNYEVGVAGGAPIGERTALRASVWYRHDAGYVDRYDPTTFTQLIDEDINSADNIAGKLSLAFRVTDAMTITPSLYYQRTKSDGRSQYWETQSDVQSQNFKTGIYNLEPSEDDFLLPAIKIEYDFGGMQLISNTSYYDRSRSQTLDYATFLSTLRAGNPFGTYGNKLTSNAFAMQTYDQKNIVQEIRLQSIAAEQKIDWTVGAYYSKSKQDALNLSASGRIPGVISAGFPQYLGRYNLYDAIKTEDEQIAGFASVDWKATSRLTATFGVRVSQNDFTFGETRDGPVNGGRRTFDGADQSATAVTPKVGATFRLDEDNMLYASASKGFRPGGAQGPVDPNFCAADLATLGLTASPRDFDSDSLWSYELGSKNALLGGALLVDVNAYYVKWKNIQQSIRLPRCSFSFISNLGEASGKGADVTLAVRAGDNLSFGASLGYNMVEYDQTLRGGNGLVLKEEGDRIGGPKFTGSVFGLGEHALGASMTGYYRFDYSFQGKGIPQNPNAFGYDPGLNTDPSTNSLSLRAGFRVASFDVSVFGNNITGSTEPLARAHDATGSPLYYVASYTPRTIGVTVSYKY